MIGVMVPSVFTPNEAYADSFNMFAKDAETDEVNGFTELDGARGVDTFVIGGSTYAIVASFDDDGVQIIDISDPTDIVAKDSLNNTDDLELNGAWGVDTFVIGNKTYAIVTANVDDGVQIIDISDPTDIVAKDSLNNTDDLELNGAGGVDIFVIGNKTYAIVASMVDDGVQIIDISDPTDIVAKDSLNNTGNLELNGAIGVDTFVIGNKTYAIVVSKIDDGVQIIDISDPTAIVAKDDETDEVNGFTELDGARGVDTFVIGGSTYAIVASFDDDGVQIIEISDPTDIVAKDSLNNTSDLELDGARGVDTFVIGNKTYAIVTANVDDGVQIIDISDPTAIVAKDDETDEVNGFTELDCACQVDTFVIGATTYAIVTADDDDGVQMIELTFNESSNKSSNVTNFSPHIHDEVAISINSNENFLLNMKDTDVTNILTNVGDTINITISAGDDKIVEQISPITLVTNFAKKPSDMNNYFGTNTLNGQTGLSVYILNQNGIDQNYSYDKILTWNDSTMVKRDRVLTNHDYVGPLLFDEQELLVTCSMIVNKVAEQTPVMVKITDDEYLQTVVVLPFTFEILPNLNENQTKVKAQEIEPPIDDKSEFFIKSDKSAYVHGNKIVITGQIPIQDFDPKQAQNIRFSITSPENQSIVAGEFAPQTDGSFTYDTFAMDTIWKTDGDYVFNFNFGSINYNLLISYDNTEFENSNLESGTDQKIVEQVVTPPVVTPPVVTPPVVTPPVVTPPVVTPPVVTPPVVTPPVVGQKIVEKIIPVCGTGTEDVNGICQVIQTKEKSSKGGGCLIATATYGSEMSQQVQQLRELRDNQLLQTASGTAFMGMFNDIYYVFSPIIADYERENPLFKEAVKIAITPIISSLSLMENANSESEVISLGLSVIMLNIGMYLGVPAVVIVGIKRRF